MTDYKINYDYMENVLREIDRNFLMIPEATYKKNNQIIAEFTKLLINKMKEKDPQFKSLLPRIFFGGNFCEDLGSNETSNKVVLNFLFTIPKFAEPTIILGHEAGVVSLQLNKPPNSWPKQSQAQFKNIEKLMDDKRFVNTRHVWIWIKTVLEKALNEVPKLKYKINIKNFDVISDEKPELNFLLTYLNELEFDIDVVPCFVFGMDHWPSGNFISNPIIQRPEFFIVPKLRKNKGNDPNQIYRFWRLSFQEQERALFEGKGNLKPTLRLILKLKDNLHHALIPSYAIKSIFLQSLDEKKYNDKTYWNDNSLSFLFMTVLKTYRDQVQSGKMPYYWNRNYNLVSDFKGVALDHISELLSYIIKDIEDNPSDPKIVCKYILNSEEYHLFIEKKIKFI